MNILIAGDFFISEKFQNKNAIDQSVIDLFQKAEYRMVNLEAPITPDNPENKILKTGPQLRMSDETVIPFLKQLNVNAVTLANNHILDYGAKGLTDTFDVLKNNQIDFVGAGNNLIEANKYISLYHDSMRIAIINFCENEWSIAEGDKPGANPMDIIANINQIKVAKTTHDKVICIIHGGHEYYQLPSPRMRKQYRFYAENGADAIVGHHTHCIGGYEVYKDVPIIYSLGNFVFMRPSKQDAWYNGLLSSLRVEKGRSVRFEIYPIQQEKKLFTLSLLINGEQQKILDGIEVINENILDEEKLKKKWQEFVNQKSNQYLNYFSPVQIFNNRYLTYFIKKLKLDNMLMSKEHYKLLQNVVRCEAHKDIALESLKSFLDKNK